MKKLLAMLLALAMMLALVPAFAGETYVIGLCNFVDDASLNQICENIENQLKKIGDENDVTFEIIYKNCNMNMADLNQIVSNFIADEVDLMIGVATPVAMTMQGATADANIPVVFAAVSDPLAVGLVESLEAPGANVTGTSDFLDTNAIMNLIFAMKPNATKVGLLYDLGQDSSTTAINTAKEYLAAKGVEYVEATGSNASEVTMAVNSLVYAGVDAVFTPSDNTIMSCELAIFETLANAGIPHFAGADSFALNGAFLGYGVDYANLGVETANMVADILVNGQEAKNMPVKTFDNGTATINTDICDMMDISYEEMAAAFAPFCTKVQPIVLGETFADVQ